MERRSDRRHTRLGFFLEGGQTERVGRQQAADCCFLDMRRQRGSAWVLSNWHILPIIDIIRDLEMFKGI